MSIELISRPRRRVPKPVSHSWIRIERWLKKRAPLILASLREPAKKKDLQALEKVLGRRLPESFRESSLIHDGQNIYACPEDLDRLPGMFFGFGPMSLSEIQSLWQAWWRTRRSLSQEDTKFNEFTSFPPDAVRNAANRRGWIPFWWGGARDTLYIDLDPDSNGVSGQIIAVSHDLREVEKQVLAESWAHFLQDVADELEAGNVQVDEPHYEGRWFNLRGVPNEFFWNAFPQWARAKLPKKFQESR